MRDPIGSNTGKILNAIKEGELEEYLLHTALLIAAVGAEAEAAKRASICNAIVSVTKTIVLAALIWIMARAG